MAKILITGAKGQLGQCLSDAAMRQGRHKIFGYDIDRLNILDREAVFSITQAVGAEVLLNCAAYTAVDQAEKEPGQAWAVNADSVIGLAEVCDRLGILLVHISTDYVFDGTSSIPYTEENAPHPLSVYGASKLAGESFALACRRGIVVRTSWLYARTGHNFISSILRLGAEHKEIRVVNDQISAPTYGPHLAEALLQMITLIETSCMADSLMGLYHFSDTGSCSRFAFAQKIKEYARFKAMILPVSSSDYPALAKRPAYSVLNSKKMTTAFDIVPPFWENGLKYYFTLI